MSIIAISKHEISFVTGGADSKEDIEWKKQFDGNRVKITIAGSIGLIFGTFLGLGVITPKYTGGRAFSCVKLWQTLVISTSAICTSALSIGIAMLIEEKS